MTWLLPALAGASIATVVLLLAFWGFCHALIAILAKWISTGA